ncbi:hypothetical protein EXIGLDRAFT_773163, partial [Exidia glandulosa HHB12029]
AAVRSLTLSLRFAYKDTPISIREISPPLVESELHDQQGTTDALSKFWIPLATYIPDVINQLVETDNAEICTQFSAKAYSNFELGKWDAMLNFSPATLKK